MLEFKEIFLKDKQLKNIVQNHVFNDGLNYIDYESKGLFNALTLKNDLFLDGTFIVDGITFLPNNINKEETLSILAINSQVLCLTLCFIVNKKDKKKFIEETQNKFLELKDLPLETFADKNEKINKILEMSISLKPSYVLVDLNDEINKSCSNFIDKSLNKLVKDVTFIILKEEYIEPNYSQLDIVNNEESKNSDKNPSNRKSNNIFSKENSKLWLSTLKEEYTSFLLISFEVLFGVFSSLLFPSYFANEEHFWGVVLVIVSVMCLVAELIFVSLCVQPYLKDEKKKKELRISQIYLALFASLAIGISYLVFALSLSSGNNTIINLEKYQPVMFISSIIVSFISLFIIVLIKYVSIPYFYLKKKLSNKKELDKK